MAVDRRQEGLRIARAGRLTRISPSQWSVVGQSRYRIYVDDASVACTCPDFTATKNHLDLTFRCKHLWAVHFTRYCERCGSMWVPRRIRPKRCPRCGTTCWDRPRPG